MAVDAAGNTYEVGEFRGTVVVGDTTLMSSGSTDTDGYVAKYDPTGVLVWTQHLRSAGYESVNNVVLDAAGNIYISGDFSTSFTLGNGVTLSGGSGTIGKAFIARYSAQGLPIWVQQTSATGFGAVSSSGLGLDATGNVYCAYFANIITIGSTTLTTLNNSKAIFLSRLSGSTGALQSIVQAFSYAPPTTTAVYYRSSLAVAPTGEVYLYTSFSHPAAFGGTTLTSRGGIDVLVAKYGTQGNFEWVEQLGGAGSDATGKAVVDASGNLYAAIRFSAAATFGTTTLISSGGFDGCLVKYSPQGVLQWAQPSGGPGSDALNSVALDASGNPYVVGLFSNAAQFGTTILTSSGTQDICVAAYTPQGQPRWAQRAGGLGSDAGSHIGLDASGEMRVLGYFASTCTFGSFSLTTSVVSEIFFAHLGSSPLATQSARHTALHFYPNPASNQLSLQGVAPGSQVQLLDAVGRITRMLLVSPDATVSVQGVKPGLYIVRAADIQGRQVTGQLVVE